jgi:NAD(P)-dependent dehydrogenase (short-subunit alcohol dehydrogenase family)
MDHWPVRTKNLDEPAHVRAFEMVRKINRQLHGCDCALRRVVFVADLDRISQGLDANPVDWEVSGVGFVLRIFHLSTLQAPQQIREKINASRKSFDYRARMNLFDLTNEVAVVIGGTGALGGALADGLAASGAKVVVSGRNSGRGNVRVDAISKSGGTAAFIEADASSRDSLEGLLARTTDLFGTPTVLVNAAGGNDPKVTVTAENPFERISPADWAANFDLNLTGGAFLPCQVFGPAMVVAGKGSIMNIASVSAHLPLSRVVAYSAAKAAVLNLTQFLAREWAPHGVRVNSITPGFFPAEQNRALLFHPDGSPTPRAASILSHTPMGRFGGSEELIGAAVFLASPAASSFVTGIDLRVDGGFLSQTI